MQDRMIAFETLLRLMIHHNGGYDADRCAPFSYEVRLEILKPART